MPKLLPWKQVEESGLVQPWRRDDFGRISQEPSSTYRGVNKKKELGFSTVLHGVSRWESRFKLHQEEKKGWHGDTAAVVQAAQGGCVIPVFVAFPHLSRHRPKQPGFTMQVALLWAGGCTRDLLSSTQTELSDHLIKLLPHCIYEPWFWPAESAVLGNYIPKFILKNKKALCKLPFICFLKEGEAYITVHTNRVAVKVWVLFTVVSV